MFLLDHDHEWGPLERSRLAGTVHRAFADLVSEAEGV